MRYTWHKKVQYKIVLWELCLGRGCDEGVGVMTSYVPLASAGWSGGMEEAWCRL